MTGRWWLRQFFKLHWTLRPGRTPEDDLTEEIHSHLDLMTEDNVGLGLPPEQARAAAKREFGNETLVLELSREARRFSGIENALRDLRAGFRSIRRYPVFSLIVILTLALGIGANSAIFSVVYAVLLKPPPYPSGERLVQIWESTSGQNIPVSWINFQHWKTGNHTFDGMAGFENADLTMTGRGDAILTHSGVVSADFFRLTGWKPLTGRLFSEADDRPGAAPVVLITDEFRKRAFSGNPHVVGTTLTLDGKAYQVVGILPPGLRFFTERVDYYLPIGPRDGNTLDRSNHDRMVVLGLLKRGMTPAAARTDLNMIMTRLAPDGPASETGHRTSIAWVAGSGTDEIRKTLLMLLAAVGLVLAIACANVASLLLIRSSARIREIAVRAAIGAGPGRLARQLLTENMVIAVMGAGLGLLMAAVCLRGLVAAGPGDIPRLWEAAINLPVLLFTAVVTLAAILAAGLPPVFRAGRLDLVNALKAGSLAATGGQRAQSFRNGLVIVQIALTLVLSFACVLLIRSLVLAQASEPGFSTRGVLALDIQLPPSRYGNAGAAQVFYARLFQDLRQEPGVTSVGAVNCPPSTGGCARGWYSIPDMPAPAQADVPLSLLTRVSSAYFDTMRIHLLAGQGFLHDDRDGEPGSVVVNEQLARYWWPSAPQDAVGRPIKFGGPYLPGPTGRIIGVVRNVNQAGLDEPPVPEMYVPFGLKPPLAMVVMIHSGVDPSQLIPAVRREVGAIDPNVPTQSLKPFSLWMEATLDRRRFSTSLLEIFASLALILSAVGIYGVLNYWVSLRQKEIAIRLSLGASSPEILRWASWHAARLLGPGLALGLLGAWSASGWLKHLVYDVSTRNPVFLLAAAAAVSAIMGIAAAVPLWRATRVDAIRNLRDA